MVARVQQHGYSQPGNVRRQQEIKGLPPASEEARLSAFRTRFNPFDKKLAGIRSRQREQGLGPRLLKTKNGMPENIKDSNSHGESPQTAQPPRLNPRICRVHLSELPKSTVCQPGLRTAS